MPEPRTPHRRPLDIENPGTTNPNQWKNPHDKKPDTGIPLDIEDPNGQPFDDEKQKDWEKKHTPEPDTAPRGSEVVDGGNVDFTI